MSFIITPLPTAVALEASNATSDAYGNELQTETQRVPGAPCRHCLRRATAGEDFRLFSYSPFEKRNPYKEVGPIFVHAGGCERYADTHRIPEDFLNRPLVLRGYDREQQIAHVAIVVDGRTEQRVCELLDDPAIAFVHARSFTHGCYLFRVDRA
jgi:hypothetical protein